MNNNDVLRQLEVKNREIYLNKLSIDLDNNYIASLYTFKEEYALTISLISRLWQTAAEIILVSGAFLVNQAVRLKEKKS